MATLSRDNCTARTNNITPISIKTHLQTFLGALTHGNEDLLRVAFAVDAVHHAESFALDRHSLPIHQCDKITSTLLQGLKERFVVGHVGACPNVDDPATRDRERNSSRIVLCSLCLYIPVRFHLRRIPVLLLLVR